MSTPAKLSDKLYRWTKPDGGQCIGRIVEDAYITRFTTFGTSTTLLVRSDFGDLYWVDSRELIEHDAGYRQREKEADEQAKATKWGKVQIS